MRQQPHPFSNFALPDLKKASFPSSPEIPGSDYTISGLQLFLFNIYCAQQVTSGSGQYFLMLMAQISYTDLCSPVRWSPSDLIRTDDTHSAIPYSTLIGFIFKLSHGFPTTKGGNNYFIFKKIRYFAFPRGATFNLARCKTSQPSQAFFLPCSCVFSFCSVHINRHLRSAEGYSSTEEPRGIAFLLLL